MLQRKSLAAIALCATPILLFQQLNGWFNGPIFKASPLAFWVLDVFFITMYPFAAAWWLARRHGVTPSRYGLPFPPPMAGELLGSSIFIAVLLFAAFVVPVQIGWIIARYPEQYFTYGTVIPRGLMRAPVVLFLSATAGLLESALYIGLPWLVWRELFGGPHRPTLFALLASAVFASGHWEQGPHVVFGAFIFGVVACKLYIKIRDLWPIVGAHTLVDVFSFW